MQPRSTLIDQFSSFAQFEQNTLRCWVKDARLCDSMEHQLSAQHVENDRFWVLYWHRAWSGRSEQSPGSALAEAHLMAYLQETCYWVAIALRKKMVGTGIDSINATYGLADYFQMSAGSLGQVLQKFDATAFNNIKVFAQKVLLQELMNELRRQKEVTFCSVWGLLYKTSNKLATEVMRHHGLSEEQIEQHRLLRLVFKEIYGQRKGDKAKLDDPAAEIWTEITDVYNCKRLGQLSQPGPTLSTSQAEERLRQLAQWLRNYERPRTLSIDRGPSEDGPVRELPDPDASGLQQLITAEEFEAREALRMGVRQTLSETFMQLDLQSQRVLCLLYGEGLSQAEIVERMGLSQPTISRRLRGARNQLTQALVDFLAAQVNGASGAAVNKPLDPKRLKDVDRSLKTFFEAHFSELAICSDASLIA